MIRFFINGKIVDFSTWRLARKLCRKDSIPHNKIKLFRGINFAFLIQIHFNCNEEMLLKSHLKKRRYVFDYYTIENEHFSIDDLLKEEYYIFTKLADIVTFAKAEEIRIKQIKNEDAGGCAFQDFVQEMRR